MIAGIDHVAIEVKDFDAAVKSYETIFGRAPSWRGAMPGARHAWFQFPNMALDVIGADGEGPQADAARAEVEKFGEGIWGLGFSVPDLDEAMTSLKFRTGEIERKMHPGMLATDLADYLVDKGVPFRDAHHIVGRMISKAEALKVSFLDLPESEWTDIPEGKSFRKKLTFAYSAERRNIQGGTGSASVKIQLAKAKKILGL